MRSGSDMTVREMGRLGGLARAKKLTARQRSQSAKKAARKRWDDKSKSIKRQIFRKDTNRR